MISVTKEQPTELELSEIEVLLGWRNKGATKQRGWGKLKQAISGPKGVDLDAAALAMNKRGEVIAACSVDDLSPLRGAMVHAGDDKGKSKDAAESITLYLDKLPASVEAVVLMLSSFTGAGFDEVNETSYELLARGESQGVTFLPISGTGKNAAIMTVIRRRVEDPTKWEIQSIEETVHIDPLFEGNRDGQVNWRDLGERYQHLFRLGR